MKIFVVPLCVAPQITHLPVKNLLVPGSTHLNKTTIKDSDNQIKVTKSWIPLSKFYEGGIVPQAPSKVEMPTNEDRCGNTN
jgi:hypothetical protein